MSFLHAGFHCLYLSFNESIWFWISWWWRDMVDVPLTREIIKGCSCKVGSIIGSDNVWYSKYSTILLEYFCNLFCRTWCWEFFHYGKFWVVICYDPIQFLSRVHWTKSTLFSLAGSFKKMHVYTDFNALYQARLWIWITLNVNDWLLDSKSWKFTAIKKELTTT